MKIALASGRKSRGSWSDASSAISEEVSFVRLCAIAANGAPRFGMTSLLDDTDGCRVPDESVRPESVSPVVGRRRAVLTDRWIDYPEATRILQRMEELRAQRAEPNRRNLLIVGSSNNGRTALSKRFATLHPSRLDAVGGVRIPVLVLPASPVLNRIRFIYGIYELLFTPYIKRGPGQLEFLDTLEERTRRLLRYVNLEMLVIDDLHHVLADDEAGRRRFFGALRWIVPEETVIAATTTAEHVHALLQYREVRDGFEIAHLPEWKLGPDYFRFLDSFSRTLPFAEPPNLSKPKIARNILKAAGGTIGGIVRAAVGAAMNSAPQAGNPPA